MVRLKAPVPAVICSFHLIFQFLMVRLKAQPVVLAYIPIFISIPYGSIKSYRRYFYIASNGISIPYGSIKSNSPTIVFSFSMNISIPYGSIKSQAGCILVCKLRWFQFLMVRLKGNSAKLISPRKYISIPYGSIKSVFPRQESTPVFPFQFLMVRLKVFQCIQQTIHGIYFNSLWFD